MIAVFKNISIIFKLLFITLKAFLKGKRPTQKVHPSLSYASSAAKINLERITIRERIDFMAENYPKNVGYIFHQNSGLHVTYSDLRDGSYTLAKNLVSLGLKKGDRIAFLLPNTSELLYCLMGSSLAGLISVPLDADYGSDEIEYMLGKVEPSAVIVYNCADYQKIINELFPELRSHTLDNFKSKKFSTLKHIIVIDDQNKQVENNYSAAWSYTNLIKNLINNYESVELPFVDCDDIFAILFTSGTTSRPKGIEKTYFSLLNTVNIMLQITGAGEIPTRQCVTFLMYHLGAIFTMLLCLMTPNYTYVSPSFKLNSKEILETIEKYKCNTLGGLPKIILNLLEHPDKPKYNLKSLRSVALGGQHVTADLIENIKRKLNIFLLHVGYGMTEVNSISGEAIFLKFFSAKNYENKVGKIAPLMECKIVDPETGRIQPHGHEGELHIRGYSITSGYWNDPEMTRKLLDKNGWLNTGDILSMGKNGELYFRSRSKEIITAKGSGRLDVYPSIVEDCLLKHPNVSEAVVFGISINNFEQEVCAWVKLKSKDISTTEEEIKKHCSSLLIDYQVPSYVKFVDNFPLNKLGKYVRHEMTKQYKLELGI